MMSWTTEVKDVKKLAVIDYILEASRRCENAYSLSVEREMKMIFNCGWKIMKLQLTTVNGMTKIERDGFHGLSQDLPKLRGREN